MIFGIVTWEYPTTLGQQIATGAGGYVDVGALVQQFNSIQMPMSYTQARQLLTDGMSLINTAESEGAGLPGQTSRDTVLGKLQFHDNVLNSADADQTTQPYMGSWDLVLWVQQAAIEANAVVAAGADTPGLLQSFLMQAQSDIAYIKALPSAIVNSAIAPTLQNIFNQAQALVQQTKDALASGSQDAVDSAVNAGNQLIAANAAHPFQVQVAGSLTTGLLIGGGILLVGAIGYLAYRAISRA